MFREFAAIAVLGIHLGSIAFVLFGGLVVVRRRWLAALHLPAAGWGVLVEMTGWGCPLTALGNALRMRAGKAGYDGAFVEQCLLGLIYPEGLTGTMQLVLAGGVMVLNLVIYAWIFLLPPESARAQQHQRGPLARVATGGDGTAPKFVEAFKSTLQVILSSESTG